jgi:Zn-dependent protease with chaperone function
MIEDVNKEKWTAIYAFLIMDLLQILFVSILTMNETTPLVVGIDLSQSDPLVSLSLFIAISVAQVLLLYLVAGRTLRQPGLVELYPHFNEDEEWHGRYTRKEIVDWILELAKQSDVTVNRIYLMNSPLPNAFTFSLPLLGSVVVVHSNTLDVLNRPEVKAIITHELGHIKNRDSVVQLLARMPSFFVDIIYLYIYLRLGLAAATAIIAQGNPHLAGTRLLVLGGFFLLSRVLTLISRIFMQKASRSAELMSDYHAASVLGHEVTINALIRLGQRVEAITVLIEEIRWLESLNPERSAPISNPELMNMITQYPLDEIDESNAREVAPYVFLTTRLRHLREVYGVSLKDSDIEAAVKPAVVSLRSKRADSKTDLQAQREGQTIDWRKVDLDDDRRLSGAELAELLKILRDNPQKMMFTREVGVNMLILDHPDFRRRVLFIANEFGL